MSLKEKAVRVQIGSEELNYYKIEDVDLAVEEARKRFVDTYVYLYGGQELVRINKIFKEMFGK